MYISKEALFRSHPLITSLQNNGKRSILLPASNLFWVYVRNTAANVSMCIFIVAGVPAEKMVEAHGTFATATCTVCHHKMEGSEIKVMLDINSLLP